MRKPWCRGIWLLGVLGVAFLSCSKSDPLVGTWQTSYGTTLTFSRGGKLEGRIETVGYTWQGSWAREGERIILQAPEDQLLAKGKTYAVLKLTANELILHGVESSDLVSGTRSK